MPEVLSPPLTSPRPDTAHAALPVETVPPRAGAPAAHEARHLGGHAWGGYAVYHFARRHQLSLDIAGALYAEHGPDEARLDEAAKLLRLRQRMPSRPGSGARAW